MGRWDRDRAFGERLLTELPRKPCPVHAMRFALLWGRRAARKSWRRAWKCDRRLGAWKAESLGQGERAWREPDLAHHAMRTVDGGVLRPLIVTPDIPGLALGGEMCGALLSSLPSLHDPNQQLSLQKDAGCTPVRNGRGTRK